jgi:hypothetical protein
MEETENKEEVNLVFGTTPAPRVGSIIIPQCCVEGRDDCKHVSQKERKVKTNIGL